MIIFYHSDFINFTFSIEARDSSLTVNSLTTEELIETAVGLPNTTGSVSDGKNKVLEMKEKYNMLGSVDSSTKSHQSSPQQTNSAIRKTSVVPNNKCTPSHKKAKAGHYKVAKAKAVSKKPCAKSVTLNETDIISRVIELERELGCQLGLLDLLCRFSRAEIDAIWDSLIWLYPDLMSKGATKTQFLQVVHG